MITPRPYLSFSSMSLFERDPKQWADEYLYHQKKRISRNMGYGSLMAEGLEADEATGDPMLDMMMVKIPKFERMDMAVEDPNGFEVTYRDGKKAKVPVLADPDGGIPILALPDTAKTDYSAFKEYKTSTRKWTQKMADESGQITFYSTAIWMVTSEVPQDIELVNVVVDYQEDGRLQPTGDMVRLPTQRTLSDVIRMTRRIRTAWRGIKELCEKELL